MAEAIQKNSYSILQTRVNASNPKWVPLPDFYPIPETDFIQFFVGSPQYKQENLWLNQA